MKSRDAVLRLKRFAAEDCNRRVSDLAAMIREFQAMALELERQILSEEERTGVRDQSHFAYSTFAKATAQRRENLLQSIAELEGKLQAAERDRDEALAALEKLEAEPRDTTTRRKGDRGATRAAVS